MKHCLDVFQRWTEILKQIFILHSLHHKRLSQEYCYKIFMTWRCKLEHILRNNERQPLFGVRAKKNTTEKKCSFSYTINQCSNFDSPPIYKDLRECIQLSLQPSNWGSCQIPSRTNHPRQVAQQYAAPKTQLHQLPKLFAF